MSRSTKSRGLTYYVSYLFILICFLAIAAFGLMYIVNICMTVTSHFAKYGCPSNQHQVDAAFHQITIWNWIVVGIITIVLYKLKEHL